MNAFLWFVAGIAVGVNVTFAYAWLSLRRANRKAANEWRVGVFANTDPSREFDELPKAEREQLVKDWMRITR